MKKILAISIIAMTAVSAANAQIASKDYVDGKAATAESNANTYTNTKIGTITAADVATEIANAVAPKANSSFVGNIPSGSSATTVIGYVDEKAAAAAEAAVTGAGLGTAATADVSTNGVASSDTGLVTGGQVYTALQDYELLSNVTSKGSATQPVYFDNNGVATAITTMQTTTNLVTDVAANKTSDSVYPSAKAVDTAISSAITTSDATKVSHTANTAVGSATQPVFVNADGTVSPGTALEDLAYKDTVGTNEIDPKAVTTAKIDDHAVTLGQLPDLPDACKVTGTDCVLESHSGAVAWEIVQRASGETLGDNGSSTVTNP